jgi:hypothetical protein
MVGKNVHINENKCLLCMPGDAKTHLSLGKQGRVTRLGEVSPNCPIGVCVLWTVFFNLKKQTKLVGYFSRSSGNALILTKRSLATFWAIF